MKKQKRKVGAAVEIVVAITTGAALDPGNVVLGTIIEGKKPVL